MRKILIILLIVILLVFGYFMMFNGMTVFGSDLLSIWQIKDKSEELDSKLQKVSTLTSVDQPKAMSELNQSAKQLLIAKEEYNDKILYSSSDDIQEAAQGIQYEMEYLWTKVGNHATKNGINLKFELKQATSGASGQYDLSFTVTGQYVAISEFVSSLENDSSLKFKIENFKIVPYQGSTDTLQAIFVVKDIGVKINRISSPSSTTGSSTTSGTTNTPEKTENNTNANTNTVTNTVP